MKVVQVQLLLSVSVEDVHRICSFLLGMFQQYAGLRSTRARLVFTECFGTLL